MTGCEPAKRPSEAPAKPHLPVVTQLDGIDVSHLQGVVDWEQVAASGKVFAFAKATEGITFVDPQFQANWAGMKKAGLVRGAYGFYRVGDDPKAQARNFLSQVSLEPGDLPPVVDIETMGGVKMSPTRLAAELREYLQTLEQATGRRPIIYTGWGFWDPDLVASFGDHPLWVADYGPGKLRLPDGWTRWTFWQHSQHGQVPGVSGPVDLDRFAGSRADLDRLCLPQAASK
ncbi:MAG: GH25 family lysozyme [Acidobacteriota bacterium]